MKNKKNWIFVIDTDLYAGNFEREMCAYITGQVGDCGVGENFADDFQEEEKKSIVEKFVNIVEHRPDEHGCNRPCAIWESPKYQSVAIFFYKKPSEELIDVMKRRSKIFDVAKDKWDIEGGD